MKVHVVVAKRNAGRIEVLAEMDVNELLLTSYGTAVMKPFLENGATITLTKAAE